MKGTINILGILASSILKGVDPFLVSATIEDAAPTDIVMVFNEVVTGTNLGFTIAGTTSTTFSSISGSGTDTITGVLAVAAEFGETVTLSYNDAVGDIIDGDSNPLATFSGTSVTNNIVGFIGNLISYWRLNDNGDDELASWDFTSITDITYDTGKSGNAAEFNGGTSRMTTNNGFPAFTDGSDLPGSVSMYVKWDTVSNDWLIHKRINTGGDQEWQFALFSGDLYFQLFSSSSSGNTIQAVGAFVPNTGQWYHIVGTYNGSGNHSGLKIYIDDSDISATTSETGTYVGMIDTNSSLTIGHAWSSSDAFSLDGLMDGVGVWDIELSAAQVTTIYDIQNGGDELV